MSETLSQKARIRLQQPLLSFSWSESPCFKQVLIRQKPPSLWVHPTIQVHFQWGRNFRSTTQSFNLLWTERSANIRNQNRICPKNKKKKGMSNSTHCPCKSTQLCIFEWHTLLFFKRKWKGHWKICKRMIYLIAPQGYLDNNSSTSRNIFLRSEEGTCPQTSRKFMMYNLDLTTCRGTQHFSYQSVKRTTIGSDIQLDFSSPQVLPRVH